MRTTFPLPAEYEQLLADQGLHSALASYHVALAIVRAVQAAGGRAWLVGGGVRDQLLGMPAKDFDLEVYGVEPAALEALCAEVGPVNDVGRSFGVLKVSVQGGPDVDVSIPRRDSKVQPGHRGFAVATDPAMPMEEAVRRRDFTMNALLADPLTGEVLDPTGGRADMEAKILRVVDPEAFGEDPLRVVRALQFAARFNLTVDPASREVLRAAIPSLPELPPERLYEEWRKLLLLPERPSVGLTLGRELGIFAVLHPELHALWDTPQEPDWHPEGDVGIHTCMTVDIAAEIVRRDALTEPDAWTLMLGALCHDLGKPATTEAHDGRIRSRGHSEAGMAPTATFLASINVDLGTRGRVAHLVRDHLTPGMFWRSEQAGVDITDGAIRRLSRRLAPATMLELIAVAEADTRGRDHAERSAYPERSWLLERARAVDALDGAAPDVLQGRDLVALGLAPGKGFGEIIRAANDLRDDGEMQREGILAALSGAKDAAEALARLAR